MIAYTKVERKKEVLRRYWERTDELRIDMYYDQQAIKLRCDGLMDGLKIKYQAEIAAIDAEPD